MMISLLFSFAIARAAAFDVSTLSSPRAVNQWSLDRANLLSPPDRARIESILAGTNARSGAEVALLILPTIGDRVPKDVATAVFKHWGIGHRGIDDGLLVLLVVDQHRIEIETGYGLEGALPDVMLSRIERERMTPAFRRGDFAGGLAAGLTEIDRVLAREPRGALAALTTPREWTLDQVVTMIAGLFALITLLSMAWARLAADPFERHRRLGQHFGFLFFWQLATLAGTAAWATPGNERPGMGMPAVLLGAVWILIGHRVRAVWRDRLRRVPRRCAQCKQPMVRQSDRDEAKFQTDFQHLEEKIGSVDYDVWVCPQRHARLDAYAGAHARDFTMCVLCGGVTRRLLGDVIISATADHPVARGHRSYECLHCGNRAHEYYELRKRATGLVAGSGGGFSGGGGSSFGGGSSGGGGAGASW